jgi:transposase
MCVWFVYFDFDQNKILSFKNTKMSKELTTEQRGGIIFCRQRDDSYQTIATTIGCRKSTVRDTLKRMDDIGTVNSKPRSGQPPLIKDSR